MNASQNPATAYIDGFRLRELLQENNPYAAHEGARDMSQERMERLVKRVIATPFGREMLESFARTDIAHFMCVKLRFDAQMDPQDVGCCYVMAKQVMLNPRHSDALLASALVHELRHAMQPSITFPALTAEGAARKALAARVREGDAFTCQMAFALANRKRDPALLGALMDFFSTRVTPSVMADIEVACEAYGMARDEKDAARCLSALYWTLQEGYIAHRYDAGMVRTLELSKNFSGEDPHAQTKLTPVETAAQMMLEIRKLPLPGFAANDFAGEAVTAALRLRRNLSPALQDKITEIFGGTPSSPAQALKFS